MQTLTRHSGAPIVRAEWLPDKPRATLFLQFEKEHTIAMQHDLYPSRLNTQAEPIRRLDPVVYGTAEDGPLNARDLANFESDGFLFFDGYFLEEDLQAFRKELHRLSRDEDVLRSEEVILEPESLDVRSIFSVHKHSRPFAELCRHPELLGMARQLLGSEVYVHQSRINYKPGFEGKGFDWHSDFETWHAEDGMPRMRAVSFSIILTDNNEFNGPLMVIPGSHHYFVPCQGATPTNHYRQSLRKQRVGVPGREVLAWLVERGGIRAPKGRAGSLLVFDCNLLHGSNANMSPYPRSNVFFVYNSVRNPLRAPYAAEWPRPAFLGEREGCTPLTPLQRSGA